MIEAVKTNNVRGVTRQVELKEKNLIMGPNGSGKSTIIAAINFGVLGYLPGYKKNETFANASGDEMSVTIVKDGKTLERSLKQGKTLQERIAVNGIEGKAAAADGMIQLAFGKDPLVVDMPLFWASTSTEKRRMLLGLVADDAMLARVMDAEKTSRETLNTIRKTRQTTDAVVARLVKSMSEVERPAGNLAALQTELKQAQTDLQEVLERISIGDANTAQRKQNAELIEMVPEYKKAIDEAKEKMRDADARIAALEHYLKVLGPAPDRTVSESGGYDLPGAVQKILVDSAGHVSGVSEILPKKFAAEAVLLESVASTLIGLIKQEEDTSADDAKIAEHQAAAADIQGKLNVAKQRQEEIKKKAIRAKACLDTAKRAQETVADIGPDADPNDRAAAEGLKKRISELEARIEPLRKIAAMEEEIEKARIDADKAAEKEEDAKTKLQGAIDAQAAIVQAASEKLAELSMKILPFGILCLEDDGKDISVFWKKDDKTKVQRQTLSGGEQAIFDAALGHALCPTGLVAIEAAEIDTWPGSQRLETVLNHLATVPAQIIVATCHEPRVIPETWNTIYLEGQASK